MYLRTKTYDLCCGVRRANGRHKLYCPLSITLGTHEVVFDSELESELCVDYVASTNAGHLYAPMNCTSD